MLAMEAKMAAIQENLPIIAHWQENQIAIAFRVSERWSSNQEKDLSSLHLDRLNRLLAMSGFILKPFSGKSLPASAQSSATKPDAQDNDLNNLQGKYLFPIGGDGGTDVICFFYVETTEENVEQSAQQGYGTGDTTKTTWSSDDYDEYYANDHTVAVVNLINHNVDELNKEEVPLVSAMPNWLHGGAKCTVNGGPAYPPLPVDTAASSGFWKVQLPENLSDSLKSSQGTGVTVLVLDTLRPFADVSVVAASQAGQSNKLLQDIVNNVTFNYFDLSEDIDIPNPVQPVTGRDVYGKLIGYPMADHGLFVAGIIRDLAPDAHVECIRVLSDFGAGDMLGLIHALEHIRNRLDHIEGAGTPLNLPLVINLSLVALPSDEELQDPKLGFNPETLQLLRDGLRAPLENLAEKGVVFVAAAGNDSDPRYGGGDTAPKRWGPRYPAAFAYDESTPGQPVRAGIPTMIPVGAVNQAENAASYSNYPGNLGIATYGGESLTPDPKDAPLTPPPAPPFGSPTKIVQPIDAVRGVYTAAFFPAPSMDDRLAPPSPQPPDYPEYAPASPTTWAYWVGTSFATPIISALAARVLQNQASTNDSVRQALLAVAAQKPLWTGLDAQSNEATPGSVIMVTQEYVSA